MQRDIPLLMFNSVFPELLVCSKRYHLLVPKQSHVHANNDDKADDDYSCAANHTTNHVNLNKYIANVVAERDDRWINN